MSTEGSIYLSAIGVIVGLILGSILSIIVAKKVKPTAKISAAPKVLLSLGFVLFVGWGVFSSHDKNSLSSPHDRRISTPTALSPQDRRNDRLEEKMTKEDAATTETKAGGPASSTMSGVEGISANWLLAKQLNRNKEVLKIFSEARKKEDVEACRRILVVRSAELARVIDEINTGSYSISDKQKMLIPLQQEKGWADAGIIAISK